MLVSIIIPVYNRAHIVGRTLDTVIAQTHRPLQLVLVDNLSSDNTLEVLNSFKREHESPDLQIDVVQEPYHTASAARNRGAGEARGEWLMFFDSDDLMAPDLVEKYIGVIEREGRNCDLVATRGVRLLADGSRYVLPFFTSDLLANHILHSILPTQRYILTRELFNRSGGWGRDVRGWDDWEIGLRLLLLNPRVAFLADAERVTVIDSGEASITGVDFSSKVGQWERTIDTMLDNVAKANPGVRFERLLHYRRVVLAALYLHEGRPDLAEPLRRQGMEALQQSYGGSLRWSLVVKPCVNFLFRHIAAGRRGAARVARYVVR